MNNAIAETIIYANKFDVYDILISFSNTGIYFTSITVTWMPDVWQQQHDQKCVIPLCELREADRLKWMALDKSAHI